MVLFVCMCVCVSVLIPNELYVGWYNLCPLNKAFHSNFANNVRMHPRGGWVGQVCVEHAGLSSMSLCNARLVGLGSFVLEVKWAPIYFQLHTYI